MVKQDSSSSEIEAYSTPGEKSAGVRWFLLPAGLALLLLVAMPFVVRSALLQSLATFVVSLFIFLIWRAYQKISQENRSRQEIQALDQEQKSDWAGIVNFQGRILDDVLAETRQANQLLETAVPELGNLFSQLENHVQRQQELMEPFMGDKAGEDNVDYQKMVHDVSDVMKEFVDTIVETSRTAVTLVDMMQDVTAETTSISDMLDEMNSITAQTNLLAINAAIEAARAGDAGRGFSVVASEVQLLSKRSGEFNEKIRSRATKASDLVKSATASIDAMASQDMNFSLQSKKSVDKLMGEVEELDSVRNEGVKSMALIAEEVKSDVANIVVRMQFQDMVTQLLQRIDERIVLVSNHLNQIEEIGDADSAEKSARLNDEFEALQRNYAAIRDSAVQQEDLSVGSVDFF